MKRIQNILLIIIVLLMMVGCASKRTATVTSKQDLSMRAKISLTLDKHNYQTSCVVKMWKNELIILSVLPMLGIEMFRLEASADGVVVIDKLNRRYTELNYEELNAYTPRKISFKMLQMLVKHNQKEDIELDLNVGTHVLKIQSQVLSCEYNTLGEAQPMNKNKYKKVSLREILPI